MRGFDLKGMLVKKFETYIKNMNEAVSAGKPAAVFEDQKLFLQVFVSGDRDTPFDKISFMILENGMIKNRDNSDQLDLGEFTVATFIPNDKYPLPMFTMEGSLHFDKYIQCRADIVPLSNNEKYKIDFCEPVKSLRLGLEPLDGLYPHTTLPGLEQFSSGGLMTAHIAPQHIDTARNWFSKYADLYLMFVNNHNGFAVLKSPDVVEEGIQRKRMFCAMFAKMAPKILSDLPELCNDELSEKIAKALF